MGPEVLCLKGNFLMFLYNHYCMCKLNVVEFLCSCTFKQRWCPVLSKKKLTLNFVYVFFYGLTDLSLCFFSPYFKLCLLLSGFICIYILVAALKTHSLSSTLCFHLWYFYKFIFIKIHFCPVLSWGNILQLYYLFTFIHLHWWSQEISIVNTGSSLLTVLLTWK